MAEDLLPELNVGLSEAEKDDLEQMIRAFRQEAPATQNAVAASDPQSRIDDLGERMAQVGEWVLKIDRRMDALSDVLRLLFKKSELMNQRIAALWEKSREG